MDWDSFWKILGHFPDILGIISIIGSFLLWLLFKNLKEEIAKQEIKYAEDRESILTDLKVSYKSIFEDNVKNNMMIGEVRQKIFTIKERFNRLLGNDKLEAINEIIKITEKDILGIDFSKLQRKIDIFISIFEK
ncbi:MAG: hypothetical protein FWD71_18080 [Oscillospiraceae bacterium]|nr:hypothetical protein [Oscillospiraceae bacterium]